MEMKKLTRILSKLFVCTMVIVIVTGSSNITYTVSASTTSINVPYWYHRPPRPEPEPEPSPSPRPSPTPAPSPTPTPNPWHSPLFHILNGVTNQSNAMRAIRDVAAMLDPHELEIGMLEMFAEQAIGRIITQEVAGNEVVISLDTLAPLQDAAIDVTNAITRMLSQMGHVLERDINPSISFIAVDASDIEVSVLPSANQADVQNVRVRTPYYELILPAGFIESEVSNQPITVSVTIGNSYTISLTQDFDMPVAFAVPPLDGDRTYQTLMDSQQQAVVGRYNPVTGMLHARVRRSETYTVVYNRVDFDDIQHLSQEMQSAIRVLATQGVVSGTGVGRFSPDSTVNRAQVAALSMGLFGRLDPNADGGFVDVNRTDWFFGAAGSAMRHGVMVGTGNNRFSPTVVMPRDQLVSLSARLLHHEMGYRFPSSTHFNQHLQIYADQTALAPWSVRYIALATRENLVVLRADGMFMPNAHVNRGDAALMLYRLYLRLW